MRLFFSLEKNKIQKKKEKMELETIRPTMDTPYGAMIIGKDVLCTPTSLCTWSKEGRKPEIYCNQPEHKRNPVCQTVNKGIGLIDCYTEPTCGGMVRFGQTERILRDKPHYLRILRDEEERHTIQSELDYAWVVIIVMTTVLLMILLGFGYKVHRRSRRRRHRLNQSRKR